jgi:hypothetical protein
VTARASSSGWANVTLTSPSSAGTYVLYVWSIVLGYVGSTSVQFTVTSTSAPPPAAGPSALELAALLAAVVVAAVAVGALLLRRRRRARPMAPEKRTERPEGKGPARGRPTPSRPPRGAGGRRGG